MSQEKQKEQQPIEINRSQFMYGLLKAKMTYRMFEGEEVKKEIEKIDVMQANLEEVERANQRIKFYYREDSGFYFTFHPKKRIGFLTKGGEIV